MSLFYQSFRVHRSSVRYETPQGSHCSEMTRWKREFAASFWLSWFFTWMHCAALFHWVFLHPMMKRGQTNNTVWIDTRLNKMHWAENKSTCHVMSKLTYVCSLQLSCICPPANPRLTRGQVTKAGDHLGAWGTFKGMNSAFGSYGSSSSRGIHLQMCNDFMLEMETLEVWFEHGRFLNLWLL